MRGPALLCLCASLLALPAFAQDENPVASAAGLHARYVLLGMLGGGATVAYARAIVEPGLRCPAVLAEGKALPMVGRDNPHAFPVVVCETVVPFGQALGLKLADVTLPLPAVKRDPQRIQIFGDTGCKASDCAPGTPAEPFATLAAAAVAEPADLILHMGDYNYRGTPSNVTFSTTVSGQGSQAVHWTYDAGDGSKPGQACLQAAPPYYGQNQPNSNFPDRWSTWRDDFFTAAGDLLASAPWVFARGNHELCSRAGPGWFYFLDAGSDLTGEQLACPAAGASTAPVDAVLLGEPYAVDLGELTILVLDTANACDYFVNPAFQLKFDPQLAALAGLAPASGRAWLMHHRPLWGVQGVDDTTTPCSGSAGFSCMNRTLQRALVNGLAGKLPASVELVLSGHMHQFQSVTFRQGDRPPQIVVGNSGVRLSKGGPQGMQEVTVDEVPAGVLTLGDAVRHDGQSLAAFGYLDVSLGADGEWSGRLIGPAAGASVEIAQCGTRARRESGSICRLAEGVGGP